MAWDASRPVPWRRLIREWLVYVVIMAALFLIFFRDDSLIGILAGLIISGPLYLLLGYVLAKFGYQRKTLRTTVQAARSGGGASREPYDARPASAPARPKPTPTRRTGGGGRPGGPRPKR
jgi:hypothetical protein